MIPAPIYEAAAKHFPNLYGLREGSIKGNATIGSTDLMVMWWTSGKPGLGGLPQRVTVDLQVRVEGNFRHGMDYVKVASATALMSKAEDAFMAIRQILMGYAALFTQVTGPRTATMPFSNYGAATWQDELTPTRLHLLLEWAFPGAKVSGLSGTQAAWVDLGAFKPMIRAYPMASLTYEIVVDVKKQSKPGDHLVGSQYVDRDPSFQYLRLDAFRDMLRAWAAAILFQFTPTL